VDQKVEQLSAAGSFPTHKRRDEQGFSLVEMLVVVAIIGILSAISYMVFFNTLPSLRADAGMEFAETQLRQAREYSIDNRRNIEVVFQGTSEMVTNYCGNPNANPPSNDPTCTTLTQLSDFFLPYGMTFQVFAGVPDLPAPDNFGNASAVSFCTGLPCTITFQSDGSVVQGAGSTNVYQNGTVFIGKTGTPVSARAIATLATTGRIKGWRWNGAAWH